MTPAAPRRRATSTGRDRHGRTNTRRLVVSLLTCIGFVLSTVLGTSPASATTLSWAQMTVAQKESAMVYAMYDLLNAERALYHLAPVAGNYNLGISAGRHDYVMAHDNLMAHQCPYEASPGTRIIQAGYSWHSWGENIGWTTDESVNGMLNMEREMFNELPPEDGHRLNILGNYRNVGINVYFDPVHFKAWYTQDFGYPV